MRERDTFTAVPERDQVTEGGDGREGLKERDAH